MSTYLKVHDATCAHELVQVCVCVCVSVCVIMRPHVRTIIYWGVAKGSSVSWVAEFNGDKNSECKLSNGWSRSYKVIKNASFCREMSGREVTGR